MISILEIVLYCIIGLAVALYLVTGIYKLIDRKKHPEKYIKKDKEKENKLDE